MSLSYSTFQLDDHYLNQLPFPVFITNDKGHFIQWNDPAKKTFGFSDNEALHHSTSLLQENLLSLLPKDTWQTILDSEDSLKIDNVRFLTQTDEIVEGTLVTNAHVTGKEKRILFLCLLQEANNYPIQELIDLKNGIESSFMTVTLDHDGFIVNCNALFLKTSGWTPKRVIGKTFWQLFPENDSTEKVADSIWRTLQNHHTWQGDVEKISKGGEPYWVHLTAIPTLSPIDNTLQFVLIEKDITKEKALQLQLERIAYIDTETGLMNAHRLEKIVSEMIEEKRNFSFVYMSIDKFYTLKDLHENHLDTTLINEFTKRLKVYFQDSTMARINENDFVILTPLGEWFIQGFLNYLQHNPIYSGNVAVPLSISGGITRFPEDQTTFSQLMKASLATIESVREAGGDSIVSLSKASHKALNRKSLVEKRLLLALDQKNLKVLYQPQLNLNNEKIIGVEAFVRWEDEEIGVVTPDELIPIAEETGLIHNIGSFMLEKACEQALAWKKQGLDLKVSINSSVREFRDKNMAKSILDTLARTGCPANLLQIEITEKFALEAEGETSIIQQMRQLENEGITFVLDDFGTGYASFRYIQLLPIKVLKIDQTFIHTMMLSEKSQKLINGMMKLGKSMDLTVIAEGVETTEQQELLTILGCDLIQGFIISKPVSSDAITKLLK